MAGNLGTLTLDIIAKIGGFTEPLDKVDRRVKQSKQRIDEFSQGASNALATLGRQFIALAAAAASLKTALEVIKLGSEFEQSLASARAVMRGTEADMQRLADAAKLMGQTTVFSASESAEALKALGTAGFSVSEAIAALPNVLKLAAASGLDLATVAKLTDDALDSFGLSVGDLASLNDVLVGASTRAGVKIEDLARGLKIIGPVATQLGVGVKDLAAAFGVLAQNAIEPEEAATQLQRALINNKKASEQLGTAQGDLIGTLHAAAKAGWGLNEVVDAYGAKGAKSVLVLISQIEAFDKLRAELQNVGGEAQHLVDLKFDTLIGDFDKLKNVIEGLGLEAYQAIEGTLRQSLRDLVDFINQNRAGIIAFFDLIALGLKSIATIASTAATALTQLGDVYLATVNALSLRFGEAKKNLDDYVLAGNKWSESMKNMWGSASAAAKAPAVISSIENSQTSLERSQASLNKVLRVGDEHLEERAQLMKEGTALNKEMRNATEAHADSMQRLNALADMGAISLTTYARAQMKANDELAKSVGHDVASAQVNPFGLPDELFFSQAENLAKQKKLMESGVDVMQSVRTASEKYADEVLRLNTLFVAGAISQETYSRALAAATKELADSDIFAAEAAKNLEQFFQEGIAVTKEQRTVTEEYSDEIERLTDLLYGGAISQEIFNRAQKQAGENGFTPSPEFNEQGNLDLVGKLNDEEKEQNDWYANQLSLLNAYRATKAGTDEIWDEKEQELAQRHADELQKIETARTKMVLSSASNLFGSMAEINKAFQGENSRTYRALFALSKSFAIAEASISLYQAIAKAGASGPFPANLGAMATVAAAMASLVSQISTVGLAHDGMDSIPKSGSWMLERGERVTTEKTSKRLDRTLDRIENQQPGAAMGGGWNVNIHEAPGTAAQVTKRDDGSLDVHIALIEEKLVERMSRGTGLAGPFDRRYGRRY